MKHFKNISFVQQQLVPSDSHRRFQQGALSLLAVLADSCWCNKGALFF